MLPQALSMGHLERECSLATATWQSGLCETWDGTVLVFKLPDMVTGDPMLAQLKLARLVHLLR